MVNKNLLISGLGGSLFPYLHDKLKKYFNLYYVDADEHLSKVYSDHEFFLSPLVTSDSYEKFIKGIIENFNIDYYIPLIDEEILLAQKEIEGFKNMRVISPSVGFTELCLNKIGLMHELRLKNVSTIDSYLGNNFDWQIDPPIFVKPNRGRGSRGICKIDSPAQLKAYYELEPYLPKDIIIQPFIEGTEYTVGATTNNLNYLMAVGTKKVIKKEGITKLAITENNPQIDKVIRDIVAIFEPCGPFNVQLKITPQHEVKIFEINPRFSTTSIMEYAGGIDLIKLFIENYDVHYKEVVKKPNEGLILYRRWENLFYYEK
jgi:carbamoyl-phosphate synthase large subunit